MLLLFLFGSQLTNGLIPAREPVIGGVIVTPNFPGPNENQDSLQLNTFGFTKDDPTPTPVPEPTPALALPEDPDAPVETF